MQALKDVNLDIYKGEFISLLGPSGCGKTTLLRSISDLQEPTTGEINFSNERHSHREYAAISCDVH